MMDIEWVRRFCLSLPHSTEKVQWEDNLVFKIGGKMYCVAALEPGRYWLSCKCAPEEFAELVERPGFVPAPYLARAHWVAVETGATLPRAEIERLLLRAYDLVFAKLPRKTQAALAQSPRTPTQDNRTGAVRDKKTRGARGEGAGNPGGKGRRRATRESGPPVKSQDKN